MDEDDQQAARIAMIRRAHGFQDEHQVHVKKAALLLDAETHWEKTRNKHDRCNRVLVRSCGTDMESRHSKIFLESYEKTSN
jgi:hypothetical protein